MEIDHIIPEWIADEQIKWKALQFEYELAEGFNIMSMANLVPCHGRCTNRKSGSVFSKKSTLYYYDINIRRLCKERKELISGGSVSRNYVSIST